jgi:hypothetical protein
MNRADGVIVILLVWQLLILLVQFPLPPIRKLINRFPLNLFPRWSVFLGPQTSPATFLSGEEHHGTDWRMDTNLILGTSPLVVIFLQSRLV